jgi:16S rRNA (uracil1498-N3)-methyltransferase
MSLPFFFVDDINEKSMVLNEDTSKHLVTVLRKATGDSILLTDGKGTKARATIIDENRKRCVVSIDRMDREPGKKRKTAIAISLVKNASRFEWFLEKATELGIDEIIPLICTRTEKEKFRYDRMKGITVSAMLQSQQAWLPVLQEPVEFNQLIKEERAGKKFIAHCLEENKQQLSLLIKEEPFSSVILLVGPEGDFTPEEINGAMSHQYIPVALGNTRLRTETAGIVGATVLLQCAL